MSLKSFLIETGDNVMRVFKRFPIAVGLCFILSVALYFEHPIQNPGFYWFTGVGAILSVSLVLWLESRKKDDNLKKDILGFSIAGGISLLHILLSIYIAFNYEQFNLCEGIALLAIATTVVLSSFCLPFFRTKNDLPVWHHVLHLYKAGLTALLFAGTLFVGVILLILAFVFLFDGDMSERLLQIVTVTSFVFIFPVLVLAYLPAKVNTQDETIPQISDITHKLTHYIIIPITLAYIGILYLYMAKILINYELPNGGLTYLVSAAMAVVLYLIFCLYPSKFVDQSCPDEKLLSKSSFDKKLIKWLPILMLPLLVLMSVGILRRISDYGLTIHRIYVLLFNIWCYAICIYLVITNTKRILWVPVSLCLAFLAVSVLPINVYTFTRYWLRHSIESQLRASGYTSFPVSIDDFCEWTETKNYNENIESQLRYLYDRFNSSSLEDIIAREYDYISFYDSYLSKCEDLKAQKADSDQKESENADTNPAPLTDTPAPTIEPQPTDTSFIPPAPFTLSQREGLVYAQPVSCPNGIRHFNHEKVVANFDHGSITIQLPYVKETYVTENGEEKKVDGATYQYQSAFTFTKSDLENRRYFILQSDTDDGVILYMSTIRVELELKTAWVSGFLCLP